MKKTYHGRCPRCCPDGGAVFTWDGWDEERRANLKKCNNCHLVLPVKGTYRDNPPEDNGLDRFALTLEAYGGWQEDAYYAARYRTEGVLKAAWPADAVEIFERLDKETPEL